MENQIFKNVTDIMMQLGLKPKLHGFDYLRETVLLVYEQDKMEENLTISIYPIVADKYEVTPMVVERSIRLLVNEAHESGGILGINEIFGCIVYEDNHIYSNGEIIAIIAELAKRNELLRKLSDNQKMIAKKDKIC